MYLKVLVCLVGVILLQPSQQALANANQSMLAQTNQLILALKQSEQYDYYNYLDTYLAKIKNEKDLQIKLEMTHFIALYSLFLDEHALAEQYATKIIALAIKLHNNEMRSIGLLIESFAQSKFKREASSAIVEKLFSKNKREKSIKLHANHMIIKTFSGQMRVNDSYIHTLFPLSKQLNLSNNLKTEQFIISWLFSNFGLNLPFTLNHANKALAISTQQQLPFHRSIFLYNLLKTKFWVGSDSIKLATLFGKFYITIAKQGDIPAERFYAHSMMARVYQMNKEYHLAVVEMEIAHQFDKDIPEYFKAITKLQETRIKIIAGDLQAARDFLKRSTTKGNYLEIKNELNIEYPYEYQLTKVYALISLNKETLALEGLERVIKVVSQFMNKNFDEAFQKVNQISDRYIEENEINKRNANYLTILSVLLLITTIGFFSQLIHQKRISRKLKINEERLIEIANEDTLTCLYNRRHWQQCLVREHSRALRNPQENTCLLMIDIDNFKQFNDKYGHSTGDEVIISVAQVIFESQRVTDCCGRYGGEEFAVLLTNCTKESAIIFADRLRKKIASNTIVCNSNILSATVSIGVAKHNADPSEMQWLHRADMALYQAKKLGKNQVVFFEEMPEKIPLAK